jgi:hypothetical protein
MAGYSDNERLKLLFKVQAANVIDSAPTFNWYESRFAVNPNISADRVLTQFNVVKANPVANKSEALGLLAPGQPLETIVSDAYSTGFSIQLSQVITGNNTTWVACSTLNDFNTQILDWIQPQKILQASGAPSIGWTIEFWNGDPDSGTATEIFATEDASSSPAPIGDISWVFNYDNGILLLSTSMVAYLTSLYGTIDPYIRGFYYIGETLAGFSGNEYTYPGDLTVSLTDGKSFGRYLNGDIIPATGLTAAEVIELSIAEPIPPTVSLTSSSTIAFNDTAISNVLNFDYTINSIGETVTSVSLEWRRGGTGTWTVLSTSTTTPDTYTHSLTDTNYNADAFNYQYIVVDSSGATSTATLNITPAPYIAPSISLTVAAVSSTSPETSVKREIGNIDTDLSGTVTRNTPNVAITSYTLQYSLNNSSWTDIGSAVSIGPGTSSISLTNHNDISLIASTVIYYRVKVVDDYQTSLSSFVSGGNTTVSFLNIIFYGSSSSAPATSSAVRALGTRMFTDGSNPFNLLTGSINRIFTAAMPASLSISQVLDLDALNANITANYILSTFNVNNGGGTATSYHVYTMTNAIPYSAGGTPAGNHRHQITR